MMLLSAGLQQSSLDTPYRLIRSVDFSHDVLSRRPERLLVIRDTMSGWTDLGNPDRLFDVLTRERIVPRWLAPQPESGQSI